jgi:hypothetical protein
VEFGDFNIDLDEHEDIEFLWSRPQIRFDPASSSAHKQTA